MVGFVFGNHKVWKNVDAAIQEITARYEFLQEDPIQVWVSRSEESLYYDEGIREVGLYLNRLHVQSKLRGKGYAREALKFITDVADRYHVSTFVWPQATTWVSYPPLSWITLLTSKFGISQRQLEKFYQRHGFTYHQHCYWVRRPKGYFHGSTNSYSFSSPHG